MSRHIQWGVIFLLGLLIIGAAASPFWLPSAKPYIVQEVEVVPFTCPETFTLEICEALATIHEVDEAEAQMMVIALLGAPVPAPADEADEESISAGIDRDTLSEYTETEIRLGEFIEIDVLHRAEGRATIWELVGDGNITRVLRFDNSFNVTVDPDLHVFLSAHPDPRTPQELQLAELAVDLGLLKGHEGGQNYELDEDIDVTQFSSVVLYSPSMERVFSTAPLQQPIQ